MVVCLILLGVANILGAMSTSFWLLFASRILAGIGSGGVFPVALSLTSDLVGPDKRQIAIGRTLMGSMTGNLLGATVSGLIGDFLGWRGVLAVLGVLVIVASAAVLIGFRGAALTKPPKTNVRGAAPWLPHHLRQSQCLLLCGGVHRRLLRARPVSLHRLVPVRSRRNLALDRRHRDRGICRRRPGLHADGFAVAAEDRRQRHDDRGRRAGRAATHGGCRRTGMEAANPGPDLHGLGFLHDPRLPAGIRQRAVGGSARDRAVAAFVLLLHGPDHRPDRLRLRHLCMPARPRRCSRPP